MVSDIASPIHNALVLSECRNVIPDGVGSRIVIMRSCERFRNAPNMQLRMKMKMSINFSNTFRDFGSQLQDIRDGYQTFFCHFINTSYKYHHHTKPS